MSFKYPYFKKNQEEKLPEPEQLKIDYHDEIEDDKRLKIAKFSPVDITGIIHPDWLTIFNNSGVDLNKKLKSLYKSGYENGFGVFPNPEDCMNVFSMSPEKIKCVIVAQDPYPGWDSETKSPVACGRCFATNSQNIPGSLERIRNSIANNFGKIEIVDKEHPNNLKGWIDQGVFLLNNTLVVYVSKGEIFEDSTYLKSLLNKSKVIWKGVTAYICKIISSLKTCNFILIGREAEYLKTEVTRYETAIHPSKRNDCEFTGECFLKVSAIKWNIM